MYTREVLAAHMTAEELGILFDRISRYQRSATNEWPITEKEGSLRRLHPFDPIGKFDLLHYGWNLGQLFSKCNAQTVYFLQTTFDKHFDRMQPRIVSKKLTLEPKKGLIKINKDFNPNFRYYSLSAKERNLQELAQEVETEDGQRETKGEKELHKSTMEKTLPEKHAPIENSDESEAQGETLRHLATNGVSHPIPKLAAEEKEEDSMDFEDYDDDEDMERDPAEEDDDDSDYDGEDNDEEENDDAGDDDTDEPASDEFIYAMLARSEARAKNRDIPKAWSPGDPLDLD